MFLWKLYIYFLWSWKKNYDFYEECVVFWCVCVRSDEQYGRRRGPDGESRESRSHHTEQTENPERPEPLHDPADLPAA